MSSVLGNNQSINEYESKRSFSGFYVPVPVKQAQHVLAQEDRTDAGQWQALCKEIYKCAVKSSTGSGNFLRDATQIVIDWNYNLPRASFAEIKGYLDMKMLLTWQKEFVSILQRQEKTLEIHIFTLADSYKVWIVINDPTTEEILKYSELYIDFLHSHSDLYFDFMVFGKDEINNIDLPDNTIKILSEE